MATHSMESDWEKKRKQAQPFINRIRFEQERRMRWTEQIGFLRKCSREGLMPKGLRVKLPRSILMTEYGRRLRAKSEHKVLKRAISTLFVKIKKVDVKVASVNVHLNLEVGMTNGWIERTGRWVTNSLREGRNQLKKKLNNKLRNLRNEKKKDTSVKLQIGTNFEKRKVVYNNSSKKLTDEQMDLLSLGLNFNLTPRKFPIVEYIQAAETLCQRLEDIGDDHSVEKARRIRNLVFEHLKRGYGMTIKSNLTASQRQVLRELKEDESIIICPADKGKAVVVEDRITYMAKTQDQICEGDYILTEKKEKTILRRLHRKLMDQLISMGITDWKEQRLYTVTGPVLASMALLIKVHKKNFPGRAYVSQIDDPSYYICRELTKILNPLDEKGDSYLQDTYHFKESITGLGVDIKDTIGSLDIVGMFPNVPVQKTLEVVRWELENDQTLAGRTKWKVDDIMKLLEISIETYFKTLDGKVYLQRDGLPIGKSISKPLAGIYMHWFEKTFVFNEDNTMKHYLKFWKRQMDDIFFVWSGSKDELETFVWHLNGVERRIQFQMELEKENFLPFLDVGITKCEGKLVTRVYRKPTHTQQYINWNSNHPKNLLLGVLKGLIHRAHKLCDLREDLLEELALLRNVFISNGYPEKLVRETLNKSWEAETLKAVIVGVEQEVNLEKSKEYVDVLHAPYVKGFSEGLQRKLNKIGIGYVPKKGETLYSNLCKLKQKVDMDYWKDVVYAVRCGTCGVCYIGETGQHFCDRRDQHKRDVNQKKWSNAFYSHLQKNDDHEINWEEVVYLDKEKNWKGRKIKEAIYINALNPTSTAKQENVMNLEKGYELDSIWGEFNPIIRSLIDEKLGRKAK